MQRLVSELVSWAASEASIVGWERSAGREREVREVRKDERSGDERRAWVGVGWCVEDEEACGEDERTSMRVRSNEMSLTVDIVGHDDGDAVFVVVVLDVEQTTRSK